MSVTVDVRQITRIGQQLEQMQTYKPMFLRDGLNEGGAKVVTQVQRALKRDTGVKKYNSVTSRVHPTKAGNVASSSFVINVEGMGIPIREFPVRIVSEGIWAAPWGVSRVFARSFAIGNDVTKMWARRTNERMSLRKLYGPNLAKELVKDPVESVFFETVAEEVPAKIFKRLFRPLR